MTTYRSATAKPARWLTIWMVMWATASAVALAIDSDALKVPMAAGMLGAIWTLASIGIHAHLALYELDDERNGSYDR